MTLPSLLAPLFEPAAHIKGIGKHLESCLMRLFGKSSVRMVDLLFHVPSGMIDRRFSPPIYEAPDGIVATFEVTVDDHHPPVSRHAKTPYRITCHNDSGHLLLTFFNGRKDYLQKKLPIGERRIVSGKIERYNGITQMSHPDYIATSEERWKIARIEALYPLVAGITNRQLGWLAGEALKAVPDLPEWCESDFINAQGWKSWKQAITEMHQLSASQDTEKLRERLAYDELLASQLALMIARAKFKSQAGVVIAPRKTIKKRIEAALPFSLTEGQRAVLDDIAADVRSGTRMMRLLQGDVGSGKTVVAMLAMADIIESGKQAALMAPTDILARQHAAFFKRILEPLGLRVALLTGKTGTPKERKLLRGQIEAGEMDIVVGTHALFQESVAFKDLALVVVDEQHRFGVEQRMQLAEKAITPPHILLMTATPIPRTLTMTLFGDMESSILREKPAGRQKIDTRALPLDRLPEVIEALRRAVGSGNKIYWICPLVEEADLSSGEGKEDIAAAEMRFKTLTSIFGNRVGMVHGRIKPDARETVMTDFAGNKLDILVATTVVEVGVDVPDATVMVIEHAERFGLSQLHQLRGRIGRGNKPSTCILLYRQPAGEVGEQRLRIMRETEDGFRIAEQDMHLRGIGDILGTRQSGMQSFRFADLARDSVLLEKARSDAQDFYRHDPQLRTDRGKTLRLLLYLFGYDTNIHFLKTG